MSEPDAEEHSFGDRQSDRFLPGRAPSLRADVSGASTLEYLGDPVVVSQVSGVSVVRRVGP